MATENILSKGSYNHPQRSDFLCAREYIFISCEGKKRVIVRFFNEFKHTLRAVEFTLIELSADGRRLGQTNVRYTGVTIPHAATFATPTAIAVHAACVDIEIRIRQVSSAKYVFRLKGGTLIARFDKRQQALPQRQAQRTAAIHGKGHKTSRGQKRTANVQVHQLSIGKRRHAALATFFATLAVLAIATASLFLKLDGFFGLPL